MRPDSRSKLTLMVGMAFPSDPKVYATVSIPALDDWHALWEKWDVVSRSMVIDEGLLDKPIKLRNAVIFYIGHIPVFLDIQLSKVTKEPLCEPDSYTRVFERGIDPDVDNPENCHAHSEVS